MSTIDKRTAKQCCLLPLDRKKLNLVELLLSYGADVNVFADYETTSGRYINKVYGYSPLQAALFSLSVIRCYLPESRASSFAAHLAILKLLVPRCDSFDLIITESVSANRIEPCVVHFFHTEVRLGCDDDVTTTKYLLRNGAVAKFSQFYDCLVKRRMSLKPIFSMSFLRLLLLAGCAFDTDFTEMEKKVLDKVEDLLSQPLFLQELSIMAIRQCIGSRQLWTKIDSLPVPRSVKDMIKLKTYSPDKNGALYANSHDPF